MKPKTKSFYVLILPILMVGSISMLLACSSTPTTISGSPTPKLTAVPPTLPPVPPTLPPVPPTLPPTRMPTPSITPAPLPLLTPSPTHPSATNVCEYVQGEKVLKATVGGQSITGVAVTGRCDGTLIENPAAEVQEFLEIPPGTTILFEFNGKAAAAYTLDVHKWPAGRPSSGKFAPREPLDRVMGFPLSVEASYLNFKYRINQEPGDYRIVVNAAWFDGNQAVFITLRVQVQ